MTTRPTQSYDPYDETEVPTLVMSASTRARALSTVADPSTNDAHDGEHGARAITADIRTADTMPPPLVVAVVEVVSDPRLRALETPLEEFTPPGAAVSHG
jgi:hypothetical protein